MQKCLLISFDFWKDDYPKISYSIASILARFKNSRIVEINHHSFNLKELIGQEKEKNENGNCCGYIFGEMWERYPKTVACTALF